MHHLEEQLRRLVKEACEYPAGNPQRQKRLTQIIRLAANKLWKENTPYYQDALQQTWLYFCSNVCGAYDATRGSVITWLNTYLRWRLQDFYRQQQEDKTKKAYLNVSQFIFSDRTQIYYLEENLAAPPDLPPILETVRFWVEEDIDGELRNIHIQGHPEVNCQVLILKRLPPEVSWKELSAQFGLSVSTLSSFYQRQCLPRLRNFAEKEGFL
ncbi:sigma-70 family RNA polymerase sigma factor [Chlorogloeopsis sp. ULAP01]|uniref:sigma-70 family RNA polymerase sigma factor n=1 Tax=Chlorogloeopsis sp. ULAP01 TaxID=3056483 RepID=UPI0025AA4B1C|nr:sigma-70 family RNA polymerase sigma factor [Chlorogloeopsis sp. ULAP01]MDM9380610.1 sigma-70 family RNA polymerase sigma factor [Chlorogloeopsis sp. ULAP01]